MVYIFDIYGTLIDTRGVLVYLEKLLGKEEASSFSRKWRETQISYSFRRSMLGLFAPFTQCTSDALHHTCQVKNVSFTDHEVSQLLEMYRKLPTFPDVKSNLERLAQNHHSIYAFSNGATSDLMQLLGHAGILTLFIDIISVEKVKKFKPDPMVYDHLKEAVNAPVDQMKFISANPFDVQGALCAEIPVVWLKRSVDARFDPWGPQPRVIISNLDELQ